MIKQVLLDLDGVLVDFVKGVCKLHGKENPYIDDANHGHFDMDKIWGMTPKEFWGPCGYSFWANLEFHSEAEELLGILADTPGWNSVCILTSPCDTDGCVDGKRDWVKKNLPDFRKRLLIGSAKEFQTNGTNRLLIDDRNENIEKFERNGGWAWTFPRPWNDGRFLNISWQESLKSTLYR